MSKRILFLLHGMGSPNKNWEDEVVKSLDDSLKLYPRLSAEYQTIEDEYEVVPIEYNSIFERQRTEWATKQSKISEKITGLPDGPLQKLGNALDSIQSELVEDDFFATHVLDVILYRFTLLGNEVKVHVAQQIVKKLEERAGKGPTVSWNFIAYSLGTSVLHDTLCGMFSNSIPGWSRNEFGENYFSRLSNTPDKIFQISNVSRALQTDTLKPYTSIFRPGEGGLCDKLISCSHSFDPFSELFKYEPKQDRWPSKNFTHLSLIDLSLITDKNTHDLDHYLKNPVLNSQIFKRLLNWKKISVEEINKVSDEYRENTDSVDFTQFQKKISELKKEPLSNISDFFDVLQQFSNILQND